MCQSCTKCFKRGKGESKDHDIGSQDNFKKNLNSSLLKQKKMERFEITEKGMKHYYILLEKTFRRL